MGRDVTIFDGHIMGASFASGDRVVVGRWWESPFGAFADVMWCRPNGSRALFAPSEPVRDFIDRHYTFEESLVMPVRVEREDDVVHVDAGPVTLALGLLPRALGGKLVRLRPRWLRTRRAWIAVEDRVARPIVGRWLGAGPGVRTHGRTRAGVREWYAIHDLLPATAWARIDGHDAGEVAACPPAGFGFSEFTSGPALVRVTAMFEGTVP
jgi:hypothetical protein